MEELETRELARSHGATKTNESEVSNHPDSTQWTLFGEGFRAVITRFLNGYIE